MRKREKLTPEERFALALDLIKREHSFAEVCSHYHVSHTTAYKIRNAFLEGGRRALAGARAARDAADRDGSDVPMAARAVASNGNAIG
jgi:transposase-like protein